MLRTMPTHLNRCMGTQIRVGLRRTVVCFPQTIPHPIAMKLRKGGAPGLSLLRVLLDGLEDYVFGEEFWKYVGYGCGVGWVEDVGGDSGAIDCG